MGAVMMGWSFGTAGGWPLRYGIGDAEILAPVE